MLNKLKEKLKAENIDILPPDSEEIHEYDPVYNFTSDPMADLSGVSKIGRMPYKSSLEIEHSRLGLGFETLDRDTFDPKKTYPFLKDSGVKHARCQTGWMKTEKEKGVYDFNWLDEIVDDLARIGIKAWLSLSFGNPLYTPCEEYAEAWKKAKAEGSMVPGWGRGYVGEVPLYHGEEAMTGWLNYVKACAEHFKGRVSHWEVWNEPEAFWCLNGEKMRLKLGVKEVARDYVEFVRQTAEAVRSAIPDAKIIADVAQTGTTYIRELGKNGIEDIIDIFSYHFYGNTPEAFIQQRVNHARANICRKGSRKIEFWQGESGRASGKSALFSMPTEYNQAKYLVRRYLTDMCCGAELTSFFTVTDFLCYYPDGRDQFYGVINAKENRPKLAFYALQAMGWMFDGLELAPDFLAVFSASSYRNFGSSSPYNVMSGAFRRKGVPVFALWIPEHVDINARPVEGCVRLTMEEGCILENPVVIDPIRRNVWSITRETTIETFVFLGAQVFNPFRVVDYPLFITDASIFEEITP